MFYYSTFLWPSVLLRDVFIWLHFFYDYCLYQSRCRREEREMRWDMLIFNHYKNHCDGNFFSQTPRMSGRHNIIFLINLVREFSSQIYCHFDGIFLRPEWKHLSRDNSREDPHFHLMCGNVKIFISRESIFCSSLLSAMC